MLFILQCDKDGNLGAEEYNVKSVLQRGGNKHLHSFELAQDFTPWSSSAGSSFVSSRSYRKADIGSVVKTLIETKQINVNSVVPVGDLKFIEQYLRMLESIRGISDTAFLKPIEVPKCLQRKDFLQRKYKIVTRENLDFDSYLFTKNASKLKDFSFTGLLRDSGADLNNGNLFVQSEVIPIESEYRVLVFNKQIRGVQHYDGDATLFPNINLVQAMVDYISLDKSLPVSYTIDVAVTSKFTCVLEVHNFVSCGTYGFSEDCLLGMYQHGIAYEVDKLLGGVTNVR